MKETNKELANELLFKCQFTGKELRPEGLPEDENGELSLVVSSKDGSVRYKHIIKTIEI